MTRDSIESQQKGFIIIRLHGNLSTEDTTSSSASSSPNDNKNSGARSNINFRSVTNEFNKSLSSIPSRIVAVHTRIPNYPGFRLVWKLFVTQVLTDENVSLRPRLVVCLAGSDMETRYQLKSYGIPTQLLPMTDTNSIKCTYHNQWMKTRKLLEEQELDFPDQDDASESCGAASAASSADDASFVECPALNDVVFRKGSRVTSIENPGNRIFRDLIRTFLEEKERVSEQLMREESESLQVAVDVTDDSFPPQSTLSSKRTATILPSILSPQTSTVSASSVRGKKNTGKAFCDWLVDYIENERKGRFLEWNTGVDGWEVMRDKIQISRKASITLYNWGKRLGAEIVAAKRLNQRSNLTPPGPGDGNNPNIDDIQSNYNYSSSSSSSSSSNNNNKVDGDADDFNTYRFIDGRSPPFEQQGPSGISSLPWCIHGTIGATTSGKKRPRNNDSFSRV